MAPTAKRIAYNPNDKSQSAILWSSGRITVQGGALDPMVVDTPPFTAYEAADGRGPVVAFQVIDWTAPSGYSLDYFNFVHPWGPSGEVPVTPSPQGTYYGPGFPIAIDFWMDPAGNGQGYTLLVTGQVGAIGGAPALTQGGVALDPDIARRLIMRPGALGAGRDYVILDGFGARYSRNGAVNMGSSPFFPNNDIARAFVVLDWTTGEAYLMDGYGNVYAQNGAQPAGGGQEWPGSDVARDLAVIDDGSDPLYPLRISKLSGNGGRNIYVVSKPPNVVAGGIGTASPASTETTSTRPPLTWAYKDPENDAQARWELLVYREAYVTANFQSEVQTLKRDTTMITGSTFRLRFGGAVTTAIAQNADAATVQAALDGLWGVPAGAIVASGTLSGTNTMTLTYNGNVRVNRVRQPLIVPQNMLGGNKIIATRTQAGTDPWAAEHVPNALINRVGNEPDARSYTPTFDIPNGGYRMLVRAKDAGGDFSPTSGHVWTQSVTRPTAPTLTVTDLGGLAGLRLNLTYSSPPTGSVLLLEYSDDYVADADLATWDEVRYYDAAGAALDPADRPTVVVDYEAPFGVTRYYRAFVYTTLPRLASNSSAIVSESLSGNQWTLAPVDHPADGRRIRVVPPYRFSNEFAGGKFHGAGQKYPVIVTDGAPRGPEIALHVHVDGTTARSDLERMFNRANTLLLRDPFGRAEYVRPLGQADWEMPLAGATAAERSAGYLTRDYHDLQLPCVATARPFVTAPTPFLVA